MANKSKHKMLLQILGELKDEPVRKKRKPKALPPQGDDDDPEAQALLDEGEFEEGRDPVPILGTN